MSRKFVLLYPILVDIYNIVKEVIKQEKHSLEACEKQSCRNPALSVTANP